MIFVFSTHYTFIAMNSRFKNAKVDQLRQAYGINNSDSFSTQRRLSKSNANLVPEKSTNEEPENDAGLAKSKSTK